MLFGRKIRTKLPEIEVRDRDHDEKNKSKRYADSRQNASYSNILPGDKVLVHQERQTKVSTRFNSVSFTAVSKQGNSVVVESDKGVQYSRITSHYKKFLQDFEDIRQQKPDLSSREPNAEESCSTEVLQAPVLSAQSRDRLSSPMAEGQDAVQREIITADSTEKTYPLRRSERNRKRPAYLKDYA